jgi:hypothetical protein
LNLQITKKQDINLALIKALVKADIPIEKISKLQGFLNEYYVEDKLIL